MSELISKVDYAKFLDGVLGLDSRIRFVAIYDGHLKAKFQERIPDILKENEIKSCLSEALKIRNYGKKINFYDVRPKFLMTHFDQINQITIPLENDEIVLLTTEIDVEIHQIVGKIIEFRNLHSNKSIF